MKIGPSFFNYCNKEEFGTCNFKMSPVPCRIGQSSVYQHCCNKSCRPALQKTLTTEKILRHGLHYGCLSYCRRKCLLRHFKMQKRPRVADTRTIRKKEIKAIYTIKVMEMSFRIIIHNIYNLQQTRKTRRPCLMKLHNINQA